MCGDVCIDEGLYVPALTNCKENNVRIKKKEESGEQTAAVSCILTWWRLRHT